MPSPGRAPARRGAEISYLSYQEALPYFNFDTAVSNWCMNFGLDYQEDYQTALDAMLSGTSQDLIIRLATYARDTGHGEGSLLITNGFRPACYQEIIGLHDANANTGPFRNGLNWNGRSVTGFWWTAEQAADWPSAYTLDLEGYDLQTLDLRYYYRRPCACGTTPGSAITLPSRLQRPQFGHGHGRDLRLAGGGFQHQPYIQRKDLPHGGLWALQTPAAQRMVGGGDLAHHHRGIGPGPGQLRLGAGGGV